MPDSHSLKLLVEQAPIAIALLDRHLRYLVANRRWQIDHGLPDLRMGESHYERLPLPERWKLLYQKVLTGITVHHEDLLTRSDGSTDWIKWQAQPWQNQTGEITGLLIYSQIVTDRKRTEAALNAYSAANADRTQAAEIDEIAALRSQLADSQQMQQTLQDRNQMLQRVLDNLPQTIFWKDRNSVYQGCNQSFATDAGVASPAEVIGKTDFELSWSAAEGETFREFDRRVMDNDRAERHVIEPPSIVNSEQGWVETSKIPLHDELGQVIGVLGTYEDISERAQEADALRQSEARLRQQAQQLQQALERLQQTQIKLLQSEKMSSLGQLVAGIAHEINNPVSFIYGNLIHAETYITDLFELLGLYEAHCSEVPDSIATKAAEMDLAFIRKDLAKLLKSMSAGADRIYSIVKSLKNFSRLDEAEVKEVDIHQGIDSTLLILQSRLKEIPDRPKVRVIRKFAKLPLVECYAGQLNQVFMHILTNAIDAIDERAEKQGELYQPQIHIETNVLRDRQISISIKDNGCGMTEAIKQRVFDPFFTTKVIGKGTGLGMAVSYQIITEKHRGKLHCRSEVMQGTEFKVILPEQLLPNATAPIEIRSSAIASD